MMILAFVSLKGGVGRTTLTANVAALLAHQGRRCLALDLDPQNALGLHLGLPPGVQAGIAPRAGAPLALAELAELAEGPVPLLPFGGRSPDELHQAEVRLAADPGWLGRRLEELVPPGTELVLIDTPAVPGPWLRQALAIAHAVVAVHLADAASYATLPSLLAQLAPFRRPQDRPALTVMHLVNQLDSRSALARDVLLALEHTLGEELLPFTIPRDEAVAEALASQRPLAEQRPGSRAVASLQQLVEQIATLLSGPAAGDRPERPSAAPWSTAPAGVAPTEPGLRSAAPRAPVEPGQRRVP